MHRRHIEWPKNPPPITPEQRRLQVEFLKMWHELLPTKYRAIEKFNHCSKIIRQSVRPGCKTLEIGAGLGEHLIFEDLDIQDYTALEVRKDFADVIRKRFPTIKVVEADI